MYLMSKHKSNNQLVKEIASTAIPINSGNGIDLEFLPSFLQSNIIQKTFQTYQIGDPKQSGQSCHLIKLV